MQRDRALTHKVHFKSVSAVLLPTCVWQQHVLASAADTRAATPVEVAAAAPLDPPGGLLLPRLLLLLLMRMRRRIVLLQWGVAAHLCCSPLLGG